MRMATLEAGRVPIYEPHFDTVLAAARRAGRLTFTHHAGEAVRAGGNLWRLEPLLKITRGRRARSR